MTVSISDMTVPEKKGEMLAAAQATVDKIASNFRRGLITEEERYRAVVETWNETDKELTDVLLSGLDKYNNIFMMQTPVRVVPVSRSNSWQVCVD